MLICLLVLGQVQVLPMLAEGRGESPAANITLNPIDDTFIEGDLDRISNINGLKSGLYIADDGHSNPRRIYLKFDLSDVDLTDLSNATLRLYNTDTRYSRTVTAYKITNNTWTEDMLTWENATEPGEAVVTSKGSLASFTTTKVADNSATGEARLEGAQYYELDLTSYLDEVDSNGHLSVVLKSDGYTLFASKEYEDGQFAPELVISKNVSATLTASADTFVEGAADRINNTNGTSTSLRLADDSHSNPRRIYLKFDLNEVDLSAFNKATLKVYNSDTRYSRVVTAHKTINNETRWEEETLSWENAPQPGDAILTKSGNTASFTTTQVAPSDAEGDARLEGAKYYELDITKYLEEVAANGQLSVVLKSDGYTVFASKEYVNGQYAPQLVLSSVTEEEPITLYHDLIENGRSSLYPGNWYPGYADLEGRFLHDFSYAGYKMGEVAIPDEVPGKLVDVTQYPYEADNTGQADATTAIQSAIDNVAAYGGGVVYLPEGTYRVKPQLGTTESLKISSSGVVLRGAGPDKTFIFNDEPIMKAKNIITITSEGNKFKPITSMSTLITKDLLQPTTVIPVQDTSHYVVGDWIQLNNKYTAEFIAEHNMQGWWDRYEGDVGVTFYRRVVAVDSENQTLTIDIPTRYPLKVRDGSVVSKMNEPSSESGVENLSIGNVENITPGLAETDYSVEGTAAYQVAGSNVIQFSRVVDSWAKNIHTYRPGQNSEGYDYHILSNGIEIEDSRNVTVVGADMRKPLYKGAGGNGYLYEIKGNDNLITDSNAEAGRHNYTFSHMKTSGNVIHNSISKDPTHVLDFHQYLSMSNLLDGMVLNGDTIEANVRPYPSSSTTYKHGQTTSQTVIWNTTGLKSHDKHPDGTIVVSRQAGHGYVIGTKGVDTNVQIVPTDNYGRETAPIDFVEGVGQGQHLNPQSLYQDQLQKRIDREEKDLKEIKVNGKSITDFQFGKLVYDIVLPYGTEIVPSVTAEALSTKSAVTVTDAKQLPGTTTITVTSEHGETVEYQLHFSIAVNPPVLSQVTVSQDRSKPGWKTGFKIDNGEEAWLSLFGVMSDGTIADLDIATVEYFSDNEDILTVTNEGEITTHSIGSANITVSVTLDGIEVEKTIEVISATPVQPDFEPIPIVSVESSSDDGNVANNVLDGDYDTRWSASGDYQWLMADIGEGKEVESISISFYNGDQRKAIFDLEVSMDGETWTKVYQRNDAGNSSGETTLLEHFDFDQPQAARYIRYLGYGNTSNAWNSITEMRIHPSEAKRTWLIRELMNDYVESADLTGPIKKQLMNSLNQVDHHLEKGSYQQAIKFIEEFLKHLNNKALQQHVKNKAKDKLTIQANVLIEKLSSK